MAEFLGKGLSQDQLDRLREHLKFENIEKNEAVNNEHGKKIGYMNEDGKFIRKGNKSYCHTGGKLFVLLFLYIKVKWGIGRIILAQK